MLSQKKMIALLMACLLFEFLVRGLKMCSKTVFGHLKDNIYRNMNLYVSVPYSLFPAEHVRLRRNSKSKYKLAVVAHFL